MTTAPTDRPHPLRRLGRGLFRSLRWVAFRTYGQLADANYRRRLYAPPKRVGEGVFRSYEPLNLHGRDELLGALLRRLQPANVVVDVGANVGTYALAAATNCTTCRLHAFEPNRSTFGKLTANVALNRLEGRIACHHLALGDSSGRADLYRSTYHELSSLNRFNAERWEAGVAAVEPVAVEPLDALVDRGDVPPPDHLKIDVEGTAPAVLRGARRTLEDNRPIIYLETHATRPGESDEAGRAAREVDALLSGLDYQLGRVGTGWLAEPGGVGGRPP